MSHLILAISLICISFLGVSQNCMEEWENKPGVLVERFSREVKSLTVSSLKSNEDLMLSFIRVQEVESKKAHYAFQFAHLDYDKLPDHRIAKALIEQQELEEFLKTIQFFIANNELGGGTAGTTYSFMTLNGLQLYSFYSDTGWKNYLIFDRYNDIRVQLSYQDLVDLLATLNGAYSKVKLGEFLKL